MHSEQKRVCSLNKQSILDKYNLSSASASFDKLHKNLWIIEEILDMEEPLTWT